jgi:hypothetical protein
MLNVIKIDFHEGSRLGKKLSGRFAEAFSAFPKGFSGKALSILLFKKRYFYEFQQIMKFDDFDDRFDKYFPRNPSFFLRGYVPLKKDILSKNFQLQAKICFKSSSYSFHQTPVFQIFYLVSNSYKYAPSIITLVCPLLTIMINVKFRGILWSKS